MRRGSARNNFNKNSEKNTARKKLDNELFFQKIYPKNEQSDINKDISKRQKIISNIKKKN
jgi:hypothetical protein